MPDRRISSAEDVLKNSTADIAKLREMGITDYSVITYGIRLQAGRSHEDALAALLHGRSLTEEQIQFVRTVLQRVSPDVKIGSKESGYMVLDAWFVGSLDRVDLEKVWFGGLFLILSPVFGWAFLGPLAILYLMLFGTLGAVGSLLFTGSTGVGS
jgi:hypothetical protein